MLSDKPGRRGPGKLDALLERCEFGLLNREEDFHSSFRADRVKPHVLAAQLEQGQVLQLLQGALYIIPRVIELFSQDFNPYPRILKYRNIDGLTNLVESQRLQHWPAPPFQPAELRMRKPLEMSESNFIVTANLP